MASAFENFCGGTFWNSTLTWRTYSPTFTNCFMWTALAWIPCAFYVIFGPIYLFAYLIQLEPCKFTTKRVSALFVLKTILSVSLILTCLASLAYCIARYAQGYLPLVSIITPTFVTLIFIMSAVVIRLEHEKRLVTSGFHSIYFFVLIIICAFYGYTIGWQIVREWDSIISNQFHVAAYICCYTTFTVQILIMFVLFCFPDQVAVELLRRKNPIVCPELTSPFFVRLTFTWILKLIRKGYKKSLTILDLWSPFDGQDATVNRKRFFQLWDEKRTLLRILVRIFGPQLVLPHFSMLLSTVGMFIMPFLLNIFIDFFDDPTVEMWKGVMISLLFFFNYIIESLSWQRMMYHSFDIGARVKAALNSAVFQKILYLDTATASAFLASSTVDADNDGLIDDNIMSDYHNNIINNNTSKKKKNKKKSKATLTSTGEAVNLVSTDVHNLGEATGQLHLIWSIPLQTILVITILFWLLNISVFAMLIILCITIVTVLLCSYFLKAVQLSQLKQKDGRIKIFTEVINGIKLLKLYTWERVFEERVMEYRRGELNSLKKFFYINSVNIFCSIFVPNLVTFTTFSIYSWFIGPLDAKKAFTSMSVFYLLQNQLLMTPVICSHFVKAKVSLKRIETFLRLPELRGYVQSYSFHSTEEIKSSIEVENGTFTWDTSSKPTLKEVNIEIKHKSLTAIVGLVGSGKSSILSAFLGEINKLKGRVKVKGTVAYVSQQAWIQNATLRDNILFGQPYHDAKYSRIVEACALKQDLDILPGGDMTVIGEKGMNLSGGQKQRVSLARSLYQDCDVYLLDDPLSAVDSHVAKHIFNHVIGRGGLLNTKTRVLVTHAINFLPYTDHIIVLDDGFVVESGSYTELYSSGGRLVRVMENVEKNAADEADDEKAIGAVVTAIAAPERQRRVSAGGISLTKSYARNMENADRMSIRSRVSIASTKSSRSFMRGERDLRSGSIVGGGADDDFDEADMTVLNPEAVGAVKPVAYKFYASQLGYLAFALILIVFITYRCFAVTCLVWISKWSGDKQLIESFVAKDSSSNVSTNSNSTYDYYSGQRYYISIFGYLLIGHAVFLLVFCVVFFESVIRASKRVHTTLLSSLVRAPMSFFEVTPVGRILNRFSRDLDVVDTSLPDLWYQWLSIFSSLLSTIIIITVSVPPFFAVAVVLAVIFVLLQHFFLPTVRKLKWEESNSRSPIYAMVCEVLTGLWTVRAFNKQSMFLKRFERLVNHNTVFNFAINAAERWLGFQLEFLGAVTTLAAAMFSVFNRSSLSGASVGMYMAVSIQDSFALCYMIRLNSAIETNMVSVERLREYNSIEPEADKEGRGSTRSLPMRSGYFNTGTALEKKQNQGKIEFKNYSMRYRPDLDYSLKNINLRINPGEKVGIVGRTGAGKSSLISALFRFNKTNIGAILIDDVDISRLSLKHLRSSITVLPQDPIIFSGSIRINLDPLSRHSDEEIWNALEQVKMAEPVRSLAGSLSHVCQADGLNFSVGQRQLVCLGRTLLHKTAILVLDEATAAVDLETDKVIQETINSHFAECTVLIIAHRLNTLQKCDRVLLLDSGVVREVTNPNRVIPPPTTITTIVEDADHYSSTF